MEEFYKIKKGKKENIASETDNICVDFLKFN
jgi:hypothetical protein